MPRPYHSPSSTALVRRCPRAAYYCYVEGRRRADVPWSEDLKGRDRSLALGTAMHAVLEDHFTPGRTPQWLGFPGQVAASGVGFLPHPDPRLQVETGIGEKTGKAISPGHDGAQRYTITIGGVPWLGYRDLVDPNGPELGTPALYDYKSTKSIKEYAKSAAELRGDLQACLYAYDTMAEIGADSLLCRWVYFEADRVRRAAPVDFILTRGEALSVIEVAAESAKELDAIDHIDHAPMNTNACADYGGCEYHEKVGGPCSARVAVGALIQARVRKPEGETTMPLNRSALNAQFATPAAAAAAAAYADAPAAVAEVTVTPPPTPAAEPAKPRGRKPSAVGSSGSLAQIAAELTSAEAVANEAAQALESAKAKMREALA